MHGCDRLQMAFDTAYVFPTNALPTAKPATRLKASSPAVFTCSPLPCAATCCGPSRCERLTWKRCNAVANKDPDSIDDEDNPEQTEADFARAVPFGDIFPSQLESWKNRRCRSGRESPKVHIGSDSRPK